MPYRICKTFEIASGHLLTKNPDQCRFPHGHSRRIEVVLETDGLDARDMVCDFKAVRSAIENALKTLDHAMCMNTQDAMYATLRQAYGERIVGFEGMDPTTEVIAKFLYDRIQEALAQYRRRPDRRYPLNAAARLTRVRVWESSTTWAEYEE